jgi:uncharacterized 2Fe-2S/4Fe-4S cluster protein (DUF4445 family)
MPTLEFRPLGRRVQVPARTRLLEAARQAGVEIDSPCGGEGACGKCLVRVSGGKTRSRSLGVLSPGAVAAGNVLACATDALEDDLVIDVRNGEVGLQLHPQARLAFSPCAGSHVGGNIAAGIVCTDLATDTEEITYAFTAVQGITSFATNPNVGAAAFTWRSLE